jgi:hypothetical protein
MTPMVYQDMQISPQIFERDTEGLEGEKKPEVENLVALSLSILFVHLRKL